MDKYIGQFPQQLREAFQIGKAITGIELRENLQQVIICGMGGSGIGGAMLKELLSRDLNIPIILNQSYDLPRFANSNSLVICSSYSGNTEETLANFKQALENKCPLVCVTSGGQLAELATGNSIPCVRIPGGMPPRSCLGYSLIAQLHILSKSGITGQNILIEMETTASFLENLQPSIQAGAKTLALSLRDSIPLIYSSTEIASIPIRWKQQINENAKMHCFANVVPEMNHNELVAFENAARHLSVILLRMNDDHPRNNLRFSLVKELIGDKVGSFTEIWSEGETLSEKMMYLVHFGDWLSLYLAEIQNVDPVSIHILDELKRRLSQHAG